jgi:hypothetical protein
MVSKTNIQETISIPSGLSVSFKEELGRRIISEIQDRTASGIDKNSKPFKSYSKEYKGSQDFKNAGKSGQVNLEATGDMLAELSLIAIGSSSITIGYDTGYEGAGQVEGNVIGSYGKSSGDSSKARDFIGLPNKVVIRLVEEMRNEPQWAEQRTANDTLINNILGRFL